MLRRGLGRCQGVEERRDVKGGLEDGVKEVFGKGEISRKRVVKERAKEMSRYREKERC